MEWVTKSGSQILVVMSTCYRTSESEDEAQPILILLFLVLPIPTYALHFSSMIIVHVHAYDKNHVLSQFLIWGVLVHSAVGITFHKLWTPNSGHASHNSCTHALQYV